MIIESVLMGSGTFSGATSSPGACFSEFASSDAATTKDVSVIFAVCSFRIFGCSISVMIVGSLYPNQSKGVMLVVLCIRITREWQLALLAGENAKQNIDGVVDGKKESAEDTEASIY